jgi:hypothetical protein
MEGQVPGAGSSKEAWQRHVTFCLFMSFSIDYCTSISNVCYFSKRYASEWSNVYKWILAHLVKENFCINLSTIWNGGSMFESFIDHPWYSTIQIVLMYNCYCFLYHLNAVNICSRVSNQNAPNRTITVYIEFATHLAWTMKHYCSQLDSYLIWNSQFPTY